MKTHKILLLCGGDGTEHEISLLSARFLASQLSQLDNIEIVHVEIHHHQWLDINTRKAYQLGTDGILRGEDNAIQIDYAIPCIHGYPGETGDIQSLLSMANLPYLGCDAESSMLCFNKISSKLWFDALNISNTPYLFLTADTLESHQNSAHAALKNWSEVFVKAACQGSSVGCYHVKNEKSLHQAIDNAFHYSKQVLIEKALKARELEVAAYIYNNELQITPPGEILTDKNGDFYTYDEKYSSDSRCSTSLEAQDLTTEQLKKIHYFAHTAFVQLGLKDLSRIDFFLTEEGDIYLNEINTFPGMTPISMFPKLLQHNGHSFIEST